jgi:hypothetical protein
MATNNVTLAKYKDQPEPFKHCFSAHSAYQNNDFILIYVGVII